MTSMQSHDDIVDNLYEQLNYLEKLPDFNESCTTLYIVEAIMTIKNLRTSEAQQAQRIKELTEAANYVIAWDKRRGHIIPYKLRDNILDAIAEAEKGVEG